MESTKEKSPEEEIRLKTAKVIIDRLLTFKDISFIDPFDILNISYDSTDEQIKRKYRSTAIQIHPDKCGLPQAGEAFNILENAYNFLSSPKTKYNFMNILSNAKERVNIIRKELLWSLLRPMPSRVLKRSTSMQVLLTILQNLSREQILRK